MNKKTKGFTLIELLVVIAIIGILSSVVLASLNTARNKGADAAIKAEMSQLRAGMELYYDSNSSYLNGHTTSGSPAKTNYDGLAIRTTMAATTSASAYGFTATLKEAGKYFCIDSSGNATTTGSSTAHVDGNCVN